MALSKRPVPLEEKDSEIGCQNDLGFLLTHWMREDVVRAKQALIGMAKHEGNGAPVAHYHDGRYMVLYTRFARRLDGLKSIIPDGHQAYTYLRL